MPQGIGGIVIAAGWGWSAPSWVGVVLAAGGLAVLGLSVALERRGHTGER